MRAGVRSSKNDGRVPIREWNVWIDFASAETFSVLVIFLSDVEMDVIRPPIPRRPDALELFTLCLFRHLSPLV